MDYETYLKRVDELRRHCYLYYVLDQPEISDADYELMFKRVRQWEDEHPERAVPQSPTQFVAGGMRTMGVTLPHRIPMLSIDNVFNYAEFCTWIKAICKVLGYTPKELIAEMKFDGLAVSIIYVDGKLVTALTRNDGMVGEVVTEQVMQIGSIPLTLENGLTGEVRGEIVIPRDIFERLNDNLLATGKRTYANARNAAAGLLRRKSVEAITSLAFVPYDLLSVDDEFKDWTYMDKHAWLTECFPSITDEIDALTVINLAENLEEQFSIVLERFDKLRETYPVDTDGVVIKTNQAKDTETLGRGTRVVNYAIAYKFNALNRRTSVKEVRYQVGTTGLVTPVIEVEPVQLNGVTVSRATAHNYEQLKLWRPLPGDWIEIERAGEVIPYITDVIPNPDNDHSTFHVPDHCPSCNTKLSDGHNSNGRYCPNLKCKGRQLARLNVVVSREALDIKKLGEKTLENLLDQEPTLWIAGIIGLTRQRLLDATGSEKVADSLLEEIALKRRTTLRRALRAEQFEQLGRGLSRRIEELIDESGMTGNPLDELIATIKNNPDASIFKHIVADPEWETRLNGLYCLDLYREPRSKTVKTQQLEGERVCITGTIPGITREALADNVRDNGAVFAPSVSKKTTILFYGHDAGSKLAKARELGVTTVDLTDPLQRETWGYLLEE